MRCIKCNKKSGEVEFSWHPRDKTHSTVCKNCISDRSQRHYRLLTPEQRQRKAQQRKNTIIRKREWYLAYKATLQCKTCGFDHPDALCFHHRDPKTKTFAIGPHSSTCAKKTLLIEIAKCDVLCANCHQILHASRRVNRGT